MAGGGGTDSMLQFLIERGGGEGQWDEALPEDEVEAASSTWLYGKEA
jgi:hypothetical protein